MYHALSSRYRVDSRMSPSNTAQKLSRVRSSREKPPASSIMRAVARSTTVA